MRMRGWIKLAKLAGLVSLLGTAHAFQICVVSSDKATAFQEAADTLIQEMVHNGMARQDISVLSTMQFQTGGPGIQDARLVVSLGTDAFRQVVSQSSKTAVLAALIPRISYERVLLEANRKSQGNVSALYLDQPFGRQVDLLRLALPYARRVGVMWGPESVAQQPLLTVALQTRGLEFSEGVLAEGSPIYPALRSALNGTDVLMAVADPNVYNASTVPNILLASYREKTPVLAFSPAYVKAGALLSVHSSAAQLGMQIAAMAGHFLQANSLPGNQYPSEFTITANEYVARSLGITLDVNSLTEKLHKLERVEKKP